LAFVALGRAERAFDEFIQLAQVKRKRESVLQDPTMLLRDRPVVQAQLAIILGRIKAMRAWLYGIVEQLPLDEDRSDKIQEEQTSIDMQLARVHTAQEARECAATLFNLGGTAVIKSGSPIERAYRDLLTLSAHIFMAEPQYEKVGRWIISQERDEQQIADDAKLIP
jgi:alkylation response protein AidB-like acyl-CoA dehydrogenase